MSFSAQGFPWNDNVAWQIVAWESDDWMFQVLAACASLVLSADCSDVMWSALAWKLQITALTHLE